MLLSVRPAQGQQAVVERNTNLRPSPSSAEAPVRLLRPGEPLLLLSSAPVNRYFNVGTTDNLEGWAYGPNIRMVEPVDTVPPPSQPPFPSARESPPPGWTGTVFALSQAYPASMPPPEARPWEAFDFRTQADDYIRSLFRYALEGNEAVEWRGERNPVRKWYHVPWLHTSSNGREFVRGLTRERSSRPRELHPAQDVTVANYAVGMYNPAGGFVIGQVWKDHQNPDPSKALFPVGTVAVKLLFTTATVAQVPYLTGTLEWDAFVALSAAGSTTRSIRTVRLLQMDLAVREARADSATGWVFGTFAYDGNAPGPEIWDRMIPVGLSWGNDPSLTPEAHAQGRRAAESVILNPVIGIPQHLGWLGRLNGPIDNPRSACLSCHGTAQFPSVSGPLPANSLPSGQKMRWFRNVPAGVPFDSGQVSLDYSLQLQTGIERYHQDNQPSPR
jgi:hypothetical protein